MFGASSELPSWHTRDSGLSSSSQSRLPTTSTVTAVTSTARIAMAVPAALDSAALHNARLRFGRNDLNSDAVSLRTFLRRTLLSPSTVIVWTALLFSCSVYLDVWLILVLIFIVGVQLVVAVSTARTCQAWVSGLQRCFHHGSAVALREGTWAVVGSTQLVPGDLIHLVQGTLVHADCLLYSGSVLMDMSALCGRAELTRAEPGHLLKAGSVIVDGCGNAVVRYTAGDTFVGQAVGLLRLLAHGLARPLAQRSYVLVCFTLVVLVTTCEVVLYGYFSGWLRMGGMLVAHEMVLFAVACLPLNLDWAVMRAVTRGVAGATRRTQAVVLRLGALHALASVDTLVVDKSGTLTSGAYVVTQTFCSFSTQYPSRDSLVQLMALATKWREPGLHAMQRATLRCADLDLCDQYVRLAYVEHEDEHRTSTVLRQQDGSLLRVTEGQVGSVLALLSGGSSGTTTEAAQTYAEAQQRTLAWGTRGLRTRAVAVAAETGPWQLAGLLTFEDTLRPGAVDLVQRCQRQLGVAVTVASGDTQAVVATVAAAVLLQQPTDAAAPMAVMTGADLPVLNAWQIFNPSALAAASSAADGAEGDGVTGGGYTSLHSGGASGAHDATPYAACRVYAEMQPENKVALVRLLQQTGRSVAVLGDGVNDAAAAHVADVGVALITPENGPTLPAQGALWGADVALPSSDIGALCELILSGRSLFAALHALFFFFFTASVQTVLLVTLSALVGWVASSFRNDRIYVDTMVPSELHLPSLLWMTTVCLLFQAGHEGDRAYWSAAPCRASYRVSVLQSAAMALIGFGGGAPLATVVPLFRVVGHYAPKNDSRARELNSMSVMLYLFYSQLFLTLLCASPVRCGLRMWGNGRLLMIVCAVVLCGLLLQLFSSVTLAMQLVLLLYCVGVSVVQDAAKLAVHCGCYHFNVFDYRRCVDRMTRRRCRNRRGGARRDSPERSRADDMNADVDEDEVEVDEEEELRVHDESAALNEGAADAEHSSPRPYSSALDSLLGCVNSLGMRLLNVNLSAPPTRAASE